MMKFVLAQVIDGAGRLGRLSNLGSHGSNIAMETPTCLLYTRGGSVPSLSADVAAKIQRVPPLVHIPTSSVLTSQDTLSVFDKGLASFTGQPDSPIYLSVHDPASPCPSGYNEKNVVSVWSNRGRVKMSPESYMSFVESCQPDIFEALSDGDTPAGSSTKRIRKAVDRTVDYLDTCLEKLKSSEKLKSAVILGVLQGGDMISQRKWCAKEVAKRPVAGMVLDGFHEGAMEESARWSLLKEVLGEVPDSRLRVLPRVGRPDDVLKAVQCGIDVFDALFPYQASERGCALVFSFQPASTTCVPKEQEEQTSDSQTNKSSNSSDANQKHAEAVAQSSTETDEIKGDGREAKTVYETDLKDSRYFDDFRPLLQGCTCYCCQNHTRAYINHLLNTKELLARVLLAIHNMHHYFAFFQAIRESLANGTFQKLVKTVTEQR